jgi:hypothetical protein
MRFGLDFVIERAQFLDARPDRRAADAQLLREFRARHAVGIGAQRGEDFGVSRHILLKIAQRRKNMKAQSLGKPPIVPS